MTFTKTVAAAVISTAFPLVAIAQSAAPDMFDRNIHQQQRIEQGLRDGSLTVQEAAALQRGEARISNMEARALSDGRLTDAERARINDAQNRQSAAIHRERSDNERGDPNSRSSQRMQADVQRNINEQRRIERGVESGQITNREAARLQQGQARVYRNEARAGADGHISRHEQRDMQHGANHQSRQIHHQRHDGQTHGWNQHGSTHNYHAGYGNNGHHYGHANRGNGGAPAATTVAPASTAVAPTSTAPRTNNGNHTGQGNRATNVAQVNRGGSGGGRGNRN